VRDKGVGLRFGKQAILTVLGFHSRDDEFQHDDELESVINDDLVGTLMMQVQTLTSVNLNRNLCQPSRLFKSENSNQACVQFQGCQVDEKLEKASGAFLGAGILGVFVSLFSGLGISGSSIESNDGRISNLPGTVHRSTICLDDHLTSETVQKTYKLPEMKEMALAEKRAALMECINPVLLSIPDLSEDPEEKRVMLAKLQQVLDKKKLTADWEEAPTKACDGLITLGLDKLTDQPEAEKAIWKKLAHQLLDKNTSPEFEARYLELIDTFYEKMDQGQKDYQYWQGKSSNLFSVSWKTSVGLLGTSGLLAWVLSRRRTRKEILKMLK
jgi:hypothetical protein